MTTLRCTPSCFSRVPGYDRDGRILIFHFAVALLSVLLLAPGCSARQAQHGSPGAEDLDSMARRAIERLLEEQPGVTSFYEEALGWIVVDMKAAKVPFFGSGSGYAVVADRRLPNPSYLRVSRFEVGGGLGAQRFKVVILIDDEQLLQRAARGTWHYELGAQAEAGAQGERSRTGPGYRAYWLTEGGAAATVTVKVARASRYDPPN